MKRLVLACAALASLCAAAPASAAPASSADLRNINNRQATIARAITYCVNHDMMSASNARALRSSLSVNRQYEAHVSRRGLTRQEAGWVKQQLSRLEARVQITCPLHVQ